MVFYTTFYLNAVESTGNTLFKIKTLLRIIQSGQVYFTVHSSDPYTKPLNELFGPDHIASLNHETNKLWSGQPCLYQKRKSTIFDAFSLFTKIQVFVYEIIIK